MNRRNVSRSATVAVATLAALLHAGCAAERSLSDLPEREMSGHFINTGGGSWFRPCGQAPGDSLWWVTFTGNSVKQRDQWAGDGQLVNGGVSFVRWRAAPGSSTGGVQVGPGSRFVLVRDILEVHPEGPDDCEAAR